MGERTMEKRFLETVSRRSFLILVSISYLITFFLMAFFTDRWGYYQFFFSLNFIFFLLTVLSISRSSIPHRRWMVIPLFFIPLFLQILLLFRDPSFSQDIMRLQFRGEAMADGLEPYGEFEINKPPMYIWMVALISRTLGTSGVVFRSVFIIFNSMIPVAMFIIGNKNRSWQTGAMAYAIWPVALMETGVAGHFDPVVALIVLISYLFLMKERSLLSGILLGAGFALKMFPLFLTPFFLLSLRGSRKRLLFFLGFFIVPVISSIPFLLANPGGLTDYILYQSSGWGSSMSFQFFLDSIAIPDTVTFVIATLALGSGILLLIYSGMVGIDPLNRFLIAGLIILTIIPAGFFSIILMAGATSRNVLLGIFPLAISASFSLISFLLLFRRRKVCKRIEVTNWFKAVIPSERVVELSALVLILLILTSAQFHPWYLIWIAPLAISSSPTISWSFLLVSGPLHFNSYPPWDMGGFF
jgi:hypothetical protein